MKWSGWWRIEPVLKSSSMTLQDWNPLSYFKELKLFSKTLFLLGFLFFGASLVRGPSPVNKTLFVALAMIAFSLASHYLAHWRYSVVINGRVSIKYSNILRGLTMRRNCRSVVVALGH